MNTLASIASIGVGATVGASCRYYIGVLSIQYLGKAFPYGTLISNVVGSFIAGILVVVILEKLVLSETYRLDVVSWINRLFNNYVNTFI